MFSQEKESYKALENLLIVHSRSEKNIGVVRHESKLLNKLTKLAMLVMRSLTKINNRKLLKDEIDLHYALKIRLCNLNKGIYNVLNQSPN